MIACERWISREDMWEMDVNEEGGRMLEINEEEDVYERWMR